MAQQTPEQHAETMWAIIAQINWGQRILQDGDPWREAKRFIMKTYSKGTCVKLRGFKETKWAELYGVVDAYQDKHRVHLGDHTGIGGDSFDDMLCHVIGLGKDFFDRVIADPTQLNHIHTVESFAYCLPHEDDFDTWLDAPSLRHRAKECIGALTDIVMSGKPNDNDLDTIRQIMNRMFFVIANDFDEAVRCYNGELYNRYYKFPSNTSHALFANLLQDVQENLILTVDNR